MALMTARGCWEYFTEEKNLEMGLEEVGNEAENRGGHSRLVGFMEV